MSYLEHCHGSRNPWSYKMIGRRVDRHRTDCCVCMGVPSWVNISNNFAPGDLAGSWEYKVVMGTWPVEALSEGIGMGSGG